MAQKNRVFCTEQFVPAPLADVFSFFSSENNLEEITPPWLNFKVQGKSTPELKKGTLIKYRLRIHGVPVNWLTEIDEWEPMHRFTDVQLKGPYSVWRHTHTFEEVNGGTMMTDKVEYRLPLGWIGQWIAGRKVEADIQSIFDFRRLSMEKIFSIRRKK